MNDEQLLQSFAEHGSEAAFRTLVERHLPLVLGTARRITGESGLAEEVAQTVFILLARKARNLRPGTILSAWLYRATRFVAARAPGRAPPPPPRAGSRHHAPQHRLRARLAAYRAPPRACPPPLRPARAQPAPR